jgi:hypothetical protein
VLERLSSAMISQRERAYPCWADLETVATRELKWLPLRCIFLRLSHHHASNTERQNHNVLQQPPVHFDVRPVPLSSSRDVIYIFYELLEIKAHWKPSCKNNRLVSPLLRLPAELRNKIYRYAMRTTDGVVHVRRRPNNIYYLATCSMPDILECDTKFPASHPLNQASRQLAPRQRY